MLTNQPTAAPTRKMWAVMIAFAVTSVAKELLTIYVPAFATLATPAVYNLVQAGMVFFAGYMVRDRA